MGLWRVSVEANRVAVMEEGRGGTHDITSIVVTNDGLEIGKLLAVRGGRKY